MRHQIVIKLLFTSTKLVELMFSRAKFQDGFGLLHSFFYRDAWLVTLLLVEEDLVVLMLLEACQPNVDLNFGSLHP